VRQMNLQRRIRRGLSSLAFGPQELSQFCSLGLRDPQSHIEVRLVGAETIHDVTGRNVLAATRPLTVGLGLEDDRELAAVSRSPHVLEFRCANSAKTLLGTMSLTLIDSIRLEEGRVLCLFRTRHPVNYCQPRNLIWKRYLHFSYLQWRNQRGPNPAKIRMVASELHALFVFYICPRPVVVVTVSDGEASNVFPMDLIGPISDQHFSLALHMTSKALPSIQRSGRVVLSDVPVERIPLAYRLGQNHNEISVPWSSVPFSFNLSSDFRMPVPEFALRVRELQVMETRNMGSHALIICRVVSDNSITNGLQFFQAHGFYEEWKKQAIR
jgi:flavin reductase (DIM6/NTAB) family NADH-FMN oxidoreductase RutF